MYLQKSHKISGILTILLVTLASMGLNAQITFQGPTTASVGETKYYYLDDPYNDLDIYSVYWASTGTIQGSSVFIDYINVQFNSASTHTVDVDYEDYSYNLYYETLNVTVTASNPAPATPSAPTVQSTNCGNTVLQRGTPPSGVTWHWQNTASGTSTYNNTGTTITRTSGSVYYLRARNSNNVWSTNSSSVSYTLNLTTRWYKDQDNDGYGDPNIYIDVCTDPMGIDYVNNFADACPTLYGTSATGCPTTVVVSDVNYMHSLAPQIESTSVSGLANDEKIESRAYYDGLGRPKQSVGIRAGGNSEDIVTLVDYDSYGRQAKDYLPYATTSNNGLYRTDALSSTNSFYNTSKYENTTNPYSEKELEASPISRVFKQAAPGADWALGMGNEIEFGYLSNTATEVRLYTVSLSYANNIYTPTLTGGTSYYGSNELYKTITKDENWTSGTDHTTEEFKDKQGRVILKRTYNSSVAHDTYYVYDDYGNLTYVLPPKAEPHTAKPDATELSELCYQYKYDDRNRLVEKKIPGKGTATDWEEIVYNVLDQPVLTRDPNLKTQGKWLFTKYDAFGRVAFTGIISNTSSRISIQTSANNTTAYTQFVEKTTSPQTIAGSTVYYTNTAIPHVISEIHTINYYDDYTFDKVSGNSESSYGVTPETNVTGLATGSKVRVLTTNEWITTVSYYDDKSRPIYVYSFNDYLNTTDKVKSKYDFVKVLETTSTHDKTGQSTISNVDTFEYDHAGRLVTQTNNLNNTISKRLVKNNYDELGQLESKYIDNGTEDGYKDLVGVSVSSDEITKTGSSGWGSGGLATNGSLTGDGYIEFQIFQTDKYIMNGLSPNNTNANYNTIKYGLYTWLNTLQVYESGSNKGSFGTFQSGDIFRVERVGSTIYYKKNGETFYTSMVTSSGTLIGDSAIYQNGGKIKDLKIVDNSKGIQTVDYSYNIRGWLKQINNPTSLGNDLFGFKLNYNEDTEGYQSVDKLYNGNISQTIWKTANDNIKRGYAYKYDNLNRITNGYSSKNSTLMTGDSYSIWGIAYDKNGNISRITRNGNPTGASTTKIDELYYTYSYNKLLEVSEAVTSSAKNEGFKDGTNTGDDYTYDANGNMLRDYNKGISSNIAYNHLNLPTSVSPSGGNISYIYDATGVKLKKIVSTGATTEYAGNYVYEGSSLKFFNHPEGYVDASNGYEYVYQYKDHLGNVRLSYQDTNGNGSVTSSEILEENNYYPFGLKHKGYNNNPTSSSIALKKTYNGKEFQDELGLNWHDYGARNYDASLGRWMNIDNHADSYFDYSPYNYAINNPVNVIDPDGNDIYILTWFSKSGETGHAGIAIDNYKTQNQKDAKGNDVLDAKGNVVTERVKDGTYTYYDLWPNDGVGKTEGQDDVKADYSNGVIINSLSDLKNVDPTTHRTGNVSPEGRAADGIVQIPTVESQDDIAKSTAKSQISSAKDYNGCYNNCSTFTQRVLNSALTSKINASQNIRPESFMQGWPFNYKDAKTVAPNNLYNAAMKVKGAKNIKGPKSVVAKPYLEYMGQRNRTP